jgi:hypothetical protein
MMIPCTGGRWRRAAEARAARLLERIVARDSGWDVELRAQRARYEAAEAAKAEAAAAAAARAAAAAAERAARERARRKYEEAQRLEAEQAAAQREARRHALAQSELVRRPLRPLRRPF